MYVNANPAPGPLTLNPYTQKTAQQSFNDSVNGNAQQASKIKLWAIRIFSDIASILTQPKKLSGPLASAAFACVVVSYCIPGVNAASLAFSIVGIALSVVNLALVIFKQIERNKGNEGELSKFFAAKAELAKIEINSRNAQHPGPSQAVGQQPSRGTPPLSPAGTPTPLSPENSDDEDATEYTPVAFQPKAIAELSPEVTSKDDTAIKLHQKMVDSIVEIETLIEATAMLEEIENSKSDKEQLLTNIDLFQKSFLLSNRMRKADNSMGNLFNDLQDLITIPPYSYRKFAQQLTNLFIDYADVYSTIRMNSTWVNQLFLNRNDEAVINSIWDKFEKIDVEVFENMKSKMEEFASELSKEIE